MAYLLAAVVIPVLWVAAIVAQRRVGLSRVWMVFDFGVGAVIGVVLAADGRVVQGVVIALVVAPILILFSAFRTVQMRYIEQKTQTILDGTPGMREAYDRRKTPSRRERKASRDDAE